jgi:hypothetical protein
MTEIIDTISSPESLPCYGPPLHSDLGGLPSDWEGGGGQRRKRRRSARAVQAVVMARSRLGFSGVAVEMTTPALEGSGGGGVVERWAGGAPEDGEEQGRSTRRKKGDQSHRTLGQPFPHAQLQGPVKTDQRP